MGFQQSRSVAIGDMISRERGAGQYEWVWITQKSIPVGE